MAQLEPADDKPMPIGAPAGAGLAAGSAIGQ
jgi:hypothetical protein